MELKELIEQLAKLDAKEFAEALRADAAKHYQFIWNGGHKTAMKDQTDKIKTIEGSVKTIEQERDALKEQIETLSLEKPDVSVLQEKYEAALKAKDETHTTEKESLAQQIDAFKMKLRDSSLDRMLSDTVRDLVALGADKDYAEVQIQKEMFRKRIRLDDEGNVSGALQKDMATPIPLADGQSLSNVLAIELLEDVPPKFRDDKRQDGSSIGREGGRATVYTPAELDKMSDDEFLKAVDEIDSASREGKVAIKN